MDNEQATPNASTQPEQPDANRTAGTQSVDAGLQQYQAQIDAIIQSRLAEERRRIQAKYGDLDDLVKAKSELDQKREAEMSEMEKLQKQIEDMKAEQAALKQQAELERLNALRVRVGTELGLPPVLSARLQGADEEEIRADAEAVKAVLGGDAAAHVPNLDAAAGGAQPTKSAVKLSPSQRAAADRAIQHGIFKSYDEYAKSLQEMQGEQ